MKGVHRLTTLTAAATLGLGVGLLPVTQAQAAAIVPCNDITAFRAAITTANATGEDIFLAANCTYTLTDAVSTLNGLPQITGDVDIIGNNTVVERSSTAPDFRVFDVVEGGDLTVGSLTVRGGKVSGDAGGGVRVSAGAFTANGGTITQNTAADGGGIRNRLGGTVTLNGTAVTSNTATTNGGGISQTVAAPGSLRMAGGSLLNNTAFQGGGLQNTTGKAMLIATQVSGNTATSGLGGGIFESAGSVSLVSPDVSGNSPNNCRQVGAVPGCND